MNILKEFKEFAIKGNVFDMAIGIIIGTAFSKVVTSLVNDLVMPLLSLFVGKINFQNLAYIIREEVKDGQGNVVQEMISLKYGSFIQAGIDFLVIAIAIFAVVRLFNHLRRKANNEEDTTVPTPKNIELLAEIRDLLKENSSGCPKK
ncbi:large-conductance mechanosensitive channel protein MscL [Marivirga sp. S37H4]|uniref:Large-conductance mechanosensitive channel n=1 Tax=Marivirga aurantiaca TaxID=2802615 RepID=A0A934WXU2_9BACT|nr:large-conductance mechanosensitive channel protein MscL [Marivirga aurantiaca]MBK6264891.1 large-conductance mechanosensitive channel protein MscL [Marivirga aurantiaca]